jgi:hypothetical protein
MKCYVFKRIAWTSSPSPTTEKYVVVRENSTLDGLQASQAVLSRPTIAAHLNLVALGTKLTKTTQTLLTTNVLAGNH